ncbi:hypothetical protein BT69DRAFT_538912, partial [Atractiella rhizophila]
YRTLSHRGRDKISSNDHNLEPPIATKTPSAKSASGHCYRPKTFLDVYIERRKGFVLNVQFRSPYSVATHVLIALIPAIHFHSIQHNIRNGFHIQFRAHSNEIPSSNPASSAPNTLSAPALTATASQGPIFASSPSPTVWRGAQLLVTAAKRAWILAFFAIVPDIDEEPQSEDGEAAGEDREREAEDCREREQEESQESFLVDSYRTLYSFGLSRRVDGDRSEERV